MYKEKASRFQNAMQEKKVKGIIYKLAA